MASRGICDLLILHGPDATEWCQYLVSLFETHHHFPLAVQSYELCEDGPIPKKSQKTFHTCRCILILLSGDLENTFDNPEVLESLGKVLKPPNKVIVLFLIDKEDFTVFFQDWPKWKSLSSEDDPDLYISAVLNSISEDSGCGSVSDTDAESDKEQLPSPPITEKLLTVQPDRIRCGVKTQIYLIFKCKLDSQIKNEVHFTPLNGPSTCLPATLQNEYMLSVDAPDLPSGLVFLKVYSGNLVMCEAKISYFTDMEEISSLLDNASNPVEFMCQAFKIMPYDRDLLDKTLTESLKNNIPASELHLFGINQIEEENVDANLRDEELPTLLHFSAKYGLKNLTALLLTCPGALQAYSVANKNGDFPNNIAEKYGYMDLRQFVDEYVETADLLRSHIKEELRNDDEDESIYESMANLSADLLMKYTMQPDTEIYLPMKGAVTPHDSDPTYMDMTKMKGDLDLSSINQAPHEKDSMLRRILEGSNAAGYYDFDYDSAGKGVYDTCVGESLYEIVSDTEQSSAAAKYRPPVPVPRPSQLPDTQPYIAQFFIRPTREENVYVESSNPSKEASGNLTRDRPQSSVYDPFVGMKTPGQRELITLQNRVKLGMISVDDAVLEFKEWQMNQKRRSDSFKFQQENLKKLRDSITRRRNENKIGKTTDLDITKPIRRGQNVEVKHDIAIYDSTFSLLPTKTEIKRRNWKTDSTSSTASSASNRSSTRSTQSMSSGMEGDNEDNEQSEYTQRHRSRHSLPEETPPPRPPRVPNRSTRSHSTSDYRNVPKVPPRGRN